MSREEIVKDYFEASQEMNAGAMAKDFVDDIEIQNIAPNFTRYIYGINQFKRSVSDDAAKMAKEMLAIFDNPKQEIAEITEKDDKTVEISIVFTGTVNKDLGPQSPYKKGESVENKSRSVFKFNEDDKIVLIQNYISH